VSKKTIVAKKAEGLGGLSRPWRSRAGFPERLGLFDLFADGESQEVGGNFAGRPRQPSSSWRRSSTSRASDPAGDRDRLLAAGATYVEDVNLPNGGYIVTLRDPWGVPFQLVNRGTPRA
jgi:hypothetical protein